MSERAFKTYRGQRTSRVQPAQVEVLHYARDGMAVIRPLRHFPLHSPTGFEWGYGGSGPADLALAILLDYFGEEPTPEELQGGYAYGWQFHQLFKDAFVAHWGDEWEISTREITDWLARPELQRRMHTAEIIMGAYAAWQTDGRADPAAASKPGPRPLTFPNERSN